MRQDKTLTTILGGNQTSRLDVVLCTDTQGQRTVELRRLSWGEGVGWYCQQTLRLDPKETEHLLMALRLNQFQWRERPAGKHGKVIPFPLESMSRETWRKQRAGRSRKEPTGHAVSALPVGKKGRMKAETEEGVTSRA